MVRLTASSDAITAPPGRPGAQPPDTADNPASAAAFAQFLPLVQLPLVTPAPHAQHSLGDPGGRTTFQTQNQTDVASRAATELKTRGDVRLTVQIATSRAAASNRTPSAPPTTLAADAVDRASARLSKSPASAQPRFTWSSDARAPDSEPHGPAADRQSSGPAMSGTSVPVRQPVAKSAEAVERHAPHPNVSNPAAQSPVLGQPASAAATAPAMISTAAPIPSPGATAPGVQPVGGITGSSRADSSAGRSAPALKNLAAHPFPQGPESSSGVRGQAMRGVFAMLRGTQSGTSTAFLRLAPDALGEMRINLSMESGRIAAIFSVTTDEAHASLADSLPELREALESRGLIVDEVRVTRAPREAGGDHHAPANQDHDGRNGLAGDSRSGPGGERESADREGRRDAAGRAAEQDQGADLPSGGTHDPLAATSRRLGVDLTA